MVSIYRLITLLGVCSSASANNHISGASYTCHSDVNGKGSFVGNQGIDAHDYKSGKGCVNKGPDGLGSVIVSPNWVGTFFPWSVEPNYCVLSYKEINCGESLDAKQDWKRGGGGKYNFNLEETSSVEVVKGACDEIPPI